MAEYIEREKVHRLVRSLKRYAWNNPDKSKYRTTVDIDEVQFGIDKIPAADVAEVRHGEWIYGEFDIPHCSECGKEVLPNQISKHCPDCGAKMDGRR